MQPSESFCFFEKAQFLNKKKVSDKPSSQKYPDRVRPLHASVVFVSTFQPSPTVPKSFPNDFPSLPHEPNIRHEFTTNYDDKMSPARSSRDLTVPSPASSSTQPLAPGQQPMTRLADFSNISLSPPMSPNTSVVSDSYDNSVKDQNKNDATSSNPMLFCNKSSGIFPNATDMPCYHSVKGQDMWGLIFDPGAARTLSSTHTEWEYLNYSLRPNHLDQEVIGQCKGCSVASTDSQNLED